MTLDELIDKEARAIALGLLESELGKQNLPLPRDTTSHIDAILASRPDIRETAQRRVDAKKDAYTEAMRAIGIEVEVTMPLDIELFPS